MLSDNDIEIIRICTRTYNETEYIKASAKWINFNIHEPYQLIDIEAGAGLMSLVINSIDNKPLDTQMVDPLLPYNPRFIGYPFVDSIFNELSSFLNLDIKYNQVLNLEDLVLKDDTLKIFIVDTPDNLPIYEFILKYKNSILISDDVGLARNIEGHLKCIRHENFLNQKINEGKLVKLANLTNNSDFCKYIYKVI